MFVHPIFGATFNTSARCPLTPTAPHPLIYHQGRGFSEDGDINGRDLCLRVKLKYPFNDDDDDEASLEVDEARLNKVPLCVHIAKKNSLERKCVTETGVIVDGEDAVTFDAVDKNMALMPYHSDLVGSGQGECESLRDGCMDMGS